MSTAPPYPRIPHVAPTPAAGRDDLVLDASELEALLARPVRVEEKLDGANVSIRLQDGAPHVGTRGGEGTSDRGGVRSRLRAWAAEHADVLGHVLTADLVLYGEWLLRRHAVVYDRLPAPVVAFDLLDAAHGAFLPVSERDDALDGAGIARPPVVFEGELRDLGGLHSLLGGSAFGRGAAEGVVVRPLEPAVGVPGVAKLVDPTFKRSGDAHWRGEPVENGLVSVRG